MAAIMEFIVAPFLHGEGVFPGACRPNPDSLVRNMGSTIQSRHRHVETSKGALPRSTDLIAYSQGMVCPTSRAALTNLLSPLIES